MKRKLATSIALVWTLFSLSAQAQNTLGELLDGGASKITRTAWLSMMPVSLAGQDFTDRVEFYFEYTANGKFSGRAKSLSGNGTSNSWGTWTMEDQGKHCIDERLTTWKMTWDECFYLYKIDNRYFSTQSDIDRSSKAYARTIVAAQK